MPHSTDDLPSLPSAESAGNEAPSASPQGAVPENGPREGMQEGTDAAGSLQNEGEPRRPRHRRRRRPAPSSSQEMAAGGDAQPSDATSAEGAILTEGEKGALPDEGQPPNPPRRRRRRRRGPPRDPGAQTASAGGDDQTQEAALGGDGEHSAAGGDPARSEDAPTAPRQATLPREHPRRRHRHHRPPRAAASPDQRLGGEAQAGGDSAIGEGPRTVRRPRTGGMRNRSPGDVRPRGGEQRDTPPQVHDAPTARREADRREWARGPRGNGSRDRRPAGRGRDAPPKKIEQKLYVLESVVDRGFEDVAEEADESVTRRIHWTIVKRTVADQKSGKPMSAVYVLQREGMESEFPNLGAARSAVNKTIVHPEKLTLSKAEHAAAKK